MEDTAVVEFVWPHAATAVRVTGEFCGWGEGVPMTKRTDGVFGEVIRASQPLAAP